MISVFENAWDKLSAAEQRLLSVMHRSELSKSQAITTPSEQTYCSASTVRRHYDKALQHFQLLPFG